ncbi:MAG: HypC/HybG/HupF family hydrogenase formation chaperone [Bryobacterales bacterium]
MCLAVPGQVRSVEQIGDNLLGSVDFGGVTRSVFLDFTPEAGPGDYVMVHVGFSISQVDEEEARENWRLLERLGLLEEPEAGGGP